MARPASRKAGGELYGLRSTPQRLAVLEAVKSLKVFSSAQMVHRTLDGTRGQVSLSTVYRSLQALTDRGVIDAVRAQGGEMLYRCCTAAPHHHLVCRSCGATVEIPAEALAELVQTWALGAGYHDLEHSLEVVGTCSWCQLATCAMK